MSKILIIDDSTMLRDMLRYALNDGGYNNITEAIDGAHGLKLAKEDFFDLVITDVNMPNMDGFTFVSELKKLPQYEYTPILFLTTENSDEIKLKGKNSGARGWILKPFVPDELLNAIDIVLNK